MPDISEDVIGICAGFNIGYAIRRTYEVAVEEPGPGDLPAGVALAIDVLAPNPFNPSTEVRFTCQVGGPVDLQIYDVTGRRVRAIALGSLGPGAHTTRWDGRDDAGQPAPSGVYFLRLQGADTASRPVKAVLLK
jgi:hypothetical protein